jgi:CheY-like chemotaxis protein
MRAGAMGEDRVPAGRARSGGRGGIPASCNAGSPCACERDLMRVRCLLVDDSDAFLQAAGAVLERGGLTVAGAASSIAEALRKARALHPDVVLVDIGLGDESGFDLARLLASDGRGGRATVILISAHPEVDYAGLIAESPAAGFLAKSELSARGVIRILGGTP